MDDQLSANSGHGQTVSRRRLLKLTAAGALGVGAANLLGASAASASEVVFAAPRMSSFPVMECASRGGTGV